MVYHNRDAVPAGVRAVCAPTETGHATEIAIPVEWLNEQQGGEWEAVRLNIAVDDSDSEDDPGAQIWWRPDWRGPDTYSGSGTFVRP